MEHTANRMQEHWTEAKLFIKKTWPKFTEVELKRINGDFDRFLATLHELYNDFPAREAEAREQLNRLFNRLDEARFKKEA
jgi:hypothetical protein